MQSNIPSKIIWILAGIIVASCAVFTIFLSTPQQMSERAQPIAVEPQPRTGLPVRFTISKIKVDAAVEQVGITPTGIMQAPSSPAQVAWYKFGPRPGEIGNAVIAGHVGWKDDIRAAFDNLPDLQVGDTLSVENDTGTTTTFIVRELRMYDLGQNSWAVFNASDEKSHLVLIACEGVWNAVTKSYSKRLVVFADKQ